MAAGTYWFHEGLKRAIMGDIVWKAGTSQTFKVALFQSTCGLLTAANQYTYDVFGDLTNQVSDANYTAGGTALTPADPTIVNDTGYKVFIMQNHTSTVWTGPCSFTARFAVIYLDGTTDYLLAYVDFGSDQTCSAGSFTINWDDTTTLKIAPTIYS